MTSPSLEGPRSKRTTSKRVLYIHTLMGWAVILVAVVQRLDWVVPPTLVLLATIYGTYTGIGHMDMRKASESDNP